MPNASHASAMPSMASVSMYGVSPRSGLPKFRQFVIAAGLRAGAGDVQRRLADGLGAAAARVEPDAAAVAVERHGDRAVGRRQAHDAGVGAGPDDRAGADVLVVLARRPSAFDAMFGAASSVSSVAPRSSGGRVAPRGSTGVAREARRAAPASIS